jgi:hypothetical protein
MQRILVLLFGFFFKPYTKYTFRAEAINALFTIKTKDKSLITHDNKFKLSFFNKVRVILMCPSKRVKMAVETYHKGHNRILTEFDIGNIVKDVRKLKEITKKQNPLGYFIEKKKNHRIIDLDTESSDGVDPTTKLYRSLNPFYTNSKKFSSEKNIEILSIKQAMGMDENHIVEETGR